MIRPVTRLLLLASAVSIVAAPADAQKKKKKGDAPMLSVGRTPMAPDPADVPAPPPPPPAPTTTIAQSLTTIPNHTTLAQLVTAANLGPVLNGPGPFTVFAPSDDAFTRLPAGTVNQLTTPAALAQLTAILRYHIVPGTMSLDQIKAAITAGGGRAALPTLNGQPLTATLENGLVLLTDANGGKAYVSQGDLTQSNGVVHVTNGLSVPKFG